MSNRIGIGTVGYGMIAKVHLVAMQANRALFPEKPAPYPRALCTRSPHKNAQLPYEAVYGSVRDLLADPAVDVVDICTPNHRHCEEATAALEAGKSVYLEKPLGCTLAEAEALRDEARARNAVNQCALMKRFQPLVCRMKDQLNGGAVGEVFHFRACFFHGSYLDPERPISWRQQLALSGGGAVMDLGVHMLDLIRYLLGDVASLRAQARTMFGTRYTDSFKTQTVENDTDEYLCATLQMQSGAVGLFETSRVSHSAGSNEVLEVFGTKGSLRLSFENGGSLLYAPAAGDERELAGGEKGPCETELLEMFSYGRQSMGNFMDSHAAALQNVCNWHAGERIFSGTPTFAEGCAAQKLVHACLDSAQSGQEMCL